MLSCTSRQHLLKVRRLPRWTIQLKKWANVILDLRWESSLLELYLNAADSSGKVAKAVQLCLLHEFVCPRKCRVLLCPVSGPHELSSYHPLVHISEPTRLLSTSYAVF